MINYKKQKERRTKQLICTDTQQWTEGATWSCCGTRSWKWARLGPLPACPLLRHAFPGSCPISQDLSGSGPPSKPDSSVALSFMGWCGFQFTFSTGNDVIRDITENPRGSRSSPPCSRCLIEKQFSFLCVIRINRPAEQPLSLPELVAWGTQNDPVVVSSSSSM